MAGFFEALSGPRKLEVRVRRAQAEDEPTVLLLEVQGTVPEGWPPVANFVTSVFDDDGNTRQPVLAALDFMQEPTTLAYYFEGPKYQLGTYIPDWTVAGVVAPDPLVGPFGGRSTLVLVLRLVSLVGPVAIVNGEVEGMRSLVHWSAEAHVSHYYGTEGGYVDWGEEQLQAYGHAIRLALAVAAADGSVDQAELRTITEAISRWGEKMAEIPQFFRGPSPKSHLDSLLDAELQSLRNGTLNRSAAVRKLRQLDNDALKYTIIGLCYDVLAADGVADARELSLITSIAGDLGLSADRVEAMRDRKILGLHIPQQQESSPEALVGLNPNWTHDRKKRYLRSEFMKWSSRLNVLSDPAKRQHAQKMLDLIGKIYKDYG